MQFLLELLGGAGIECVAVVELVVDERLSDRSSGLGGDLLKNLFEAGGERGSRMMRRH